MKILRVDLEIPFWCSFSEYGTVNIRPTYPFPPTTTLFGLIQNALKKPALHNLNETERKLIAKHYLNSYSQLNFAIIIRENGEKIDDYLNIHKGSRETELFENSLNEKLKEKVKDMDLTEDDEEKIKEVINKLKSRKFLKNLKKLNNNEKLSKKDEKDTSALNELINETKSYELIQYIHDFWKSVGRGFNGYNLNKKWISTQINRQRLIMPKYTIYIKSTDQKGEYSLENLCNHLKSPKRPLYLGESDDIVNFSKIELMNVDDELIKSSKINSVIPGIYTNCKLIKIPIKLKNDISDEEGHNLICSIPEGELNCELSCLKVNGDNIVFLQGNSKE